MATYDKIRNITALAGATTNIYRFAVFNASGQAVNAGAGAFCEGVFLENGVTVGNAVALGLPDGAIMKVQAGAAITRGALVASNASGQAVTATSGNAVMGRALTAAGAANEIIEVQFLYRGQQS